MKPIETRYRGRRFSNGCILEACDPNPKPKEECHWRHIRPGPSLEIRKHSPGGFEWGYDGSGPAQLALALLLDFTEDKELTVAAYQVFKTRLIRPITTDEWELSGTEIQRELESITALFEHDELGGLPEFRGDQ